MAHSLSFSLTSNASHCYSLSLSFVYSLFRSFCLFFVLCFVILYNTSFSRSLSLSLCLSVSLALTHRVYKLLPSFAAATAADCAAYCAACCSADCAALSCLWCAADDACDGVASAGIASNSTRRWAEHWRLPRPPVRCLACRRCDACWRPASVAGTWNASSVCGRSSPSSPANERGEKERN